MSSKLRKLRFTFDGMCVVFQVQLANPKQLGDHYASKHPKEKPPSESEWLNSLVNWGEPERKERETKQQKQCLSCVVSERVFLWKVSVKKTFYLLRVPQNHSLVLWILYNYEGWEIKLFPSHLELKVLIKVLVWYLHSI